MPIPLILPQALPSASGGTAVVLTPGAPNHATYEVFVMDASRNLVGLVDAYDQLSMVPRFNAVGSWALTLDASHPMAAYLKLPGYGIYVNRYIQDTNGYVLHADQPLFSGPMRNRQTQKQSGVKTLTVSGNDNLIYIAERDAWPVTNYPYDGMVLLEPNYTYYTFGDASGTTATDTSGNSRNGTYHGTFTLGQATGLDDLGTGVLLDGSSGYIDAGATHYGVGDPADPNAAGSTWIGFSVHGWFSPAALPSVGNTAKLAANSNTDSDNKGFKLQINHDGTLTAYTGTGATFQSVSTTSAVAVGGWYHAALQWDAENGTLDLYLNGVKEGTHAFAPAGVPDNTTYTLQFGRGVTGINYFHGTLAKWSILDGWWSASQILNFYQTGITRFAEDSVYTNGIGYEQTDLAENVIWNTVNTNAAAGAISSRQVSGLSMATNGHTGSTVTISQRFDNLIAKDGTGVLQTAATASSPELGFKVTQSGASLTFAVYVPADKTSNCIFSDELGNIGDWSYEQDAPDFETEGNYVVVGGAGSGTTRAFYLAQNSTSVSQWGRAEAFVDDRNTSDSATLTTDATSALAQFTGKIQWSAQLLPTSGLVYGIDFGLGDKVTVITDDGVLTDLVREVQIDLDPANGEVVTIAVGTTGAQAEPLGDADITGRFYGPKNATPAKHGKQHHHGKKHLKGHHHAKHLRKHAKAQHRDQHARQKLERRY